MMHNKSQDLARPPETLILLDIDGTLLHANGAGRAAMASTLPQVFGRAGTRANIASHSFGGKTDRQSLLELLLPEGLTAPEIERRLPEFTATLAREMEQLLPQHRVHPLPGVLATLKYWRQRPEMLLGILTGNTAASAALKLRAADIAPAWFPIGAYGDEAPQREYLAALALKRAEDWRQRAFASEQIFVIGDTPADIAAARAIGARAFAIASGYVPYETLLAARPDRLFHHFDELVAACA